MDRVGQDLLRSSKLWEPLIAAEIYVFLHFFLPLLGPQAPFPLSPQLHPSRNGNENTL